MNIKQWIRRKKINSELKGVRSREDLVKALEENKKLNDLLDKER